MDCERARELFSDYLEADLDAMLNELMSSHLGTCAKCRREYDLFRQTWVALGTMSEVCVPTNMRHDVLMRMARIQHQQRQGVREVVPSIDWAQMIKRLFPARPVMVACTAAVLVLALWKVSTNTFTPGGNVSTSSVVANPTIEQNVGELSPLDQGPKAAWQGRKLGRNTVWTKIDREERNAGMALYRITLSINDAALLNGVQTARIGAKVYLLQSGDYNPTDISTARVVWDGNILKGPGIQIPLIVDETQDRGGGVVSLVVSWRFRNREHAQVIYIPSQRRSPKDVLAIQMNGNSSSSDGSIYSTLRDIAADYSLPIVANAGLAGKSQPVNLGNGNIDQALRNSLEPIGLDWVCSDKAVYVDKKYVMDVNAQ